MKRKDWLLVVIVACCTFLITFVGATISHSKVKKEEEKIIKNTSSFTIKFIKEVNKNSKNKNYIVSPYSIEMALSMLKVGADGDTLVQIDNVLRDREFNLENDNIKIANAIFIKNYYKNVVEKDFINTLSSNYNSDVLFDEFTTPDVINNWVNEKTNKMIPKILDDIDKDFALGLANAISIDAKWSYPFECQDTRSFEFVNGKKKMNVEMMQQTYDEGVKYLEGDNVGVILPYKEKLEFVGIMPKDDLSDFIDNLDDKSLNDYLNSFKKMSDNDRVTLKLPRFSYSYDLDEFKNILISLGIKDAFDEELANFDKIITKDNLNSLGKKNLYVGAAIHKARIELSERGTKAAAVTYFGVEAATAALEDDYNYINIQFDKPFMYLIRDTKTKEIIFFGTVYEPNKWTGSTCSNN